TPVAPPHAARLEQDEIPSAMALATAKPRPRRPESYLLIETFGSPFSPLNEQELQISLLRSLRLPAVLVGSSALGAIGRTLQCLAALAVHEIVPEAVVLIGDPDDFAVRELEKHQDRPVFALRLPTAWTADGVRQAAIEQNDVLLAIRDTLTRPRSS